MVNWISSEMKRIGLVCDASQENDMHEFQTEKVGEIAVLMQASSWLFSDDSLSLVPIDEQFDFSNPIMVSISKKKVRKL